MTDEFDDDLDFSPAIERAAATSETARRTRVAASKRAATRPTGTAGSKAPKARGRWRRRLASSVILGAALVGSGLGYGLFSSASSADETASSADDIEAGRILFTTSCIACHGANLEGVKNRGPSLIGIGSAATYFQVSTGRMPAMRQEAQIPEKDPKFTDEESRQLAAYVQSNGGGNELPEGNLRDGDVAEGGELFRLNCASCHNFAGKGAPLSAGAYAPAINATDEQIYAVMLSGAQNMPTFSDNQLTPAQKRSIVSYIQSLKASNDPGGAAIGRAGPVPEGLVIFIVGIGGLMGVILWIGAKS
ncbi:MAG: qcrC [Pseudonocardiales bacterium]|nr:qcrC [Jatrophihabitantaceae bacterium]MCW2603366.1 qcrC [Pseudonocardiales bacterium]